MSQAAWVDVANAAILKTGTQLITSLSQQVTAARLCNNRLPICVPLVLRRYPWKSAMDTVALQPLASPPPDPAWGFAYPLPTDMVKVWKYVPGSPLAGVNYGSNFVIRKNQMWANDGVNGDTGANPILTYVANPYATGPGTLDFCLLEAIACQLAVDICYQLTQSLPLKQSLQAELKATIQNARTMDAMETPEVYDMQASEFLTARFAGTGYMGVNNPGFPTSQ